MLHARDISIACSCVLCCGTLSVVHEATLVYIVYSQSELKQILEAFVYSYVIHGCFADRLSIYLKYISINIFVCIWREILDLHIRHITCWSLSITTFYFITSQVHGAIISPTMGFVTKLFYCISPCFEMYFLQI